MSVGRSLSRSHLGSGCWCLAGPVAWPRSRPCPQRRSRAPLRVLLVRVSAPRMSAVARLSGSWRSRQRRRARAGSRAGRGFFGELTLVAGCVSGRSFARGRSSRSVGAARRSRCSRQGRLPGALSRCSAALRRAVVSLLSAARHRGAHVGVYWHFDEFSARRLGHPGVLVPTAMFVALRRVLVAVFSAGLHPGAHLDGCWLLDVSLSRGKRQLDSPVLGRGVLGAARRGAGTAMLR